MDANLYTLAIVSLAVLTLVLLCWLARGDRYHHIGKRLLDAAGSDDAAEAAIGYAETQRVMREGEARRRCEVVSNVVSIRFTNKGRPVQFHNDGAA